MCGLVLGLCLVIVYALWYVFVVCFGRGLFGFCFGWCDFVVFCSGGLGCGLVCCVFVVRFGVGYLGVVVFVCLGCCGW